jgi:hypothetical protein
MVKNKFYFLVFILNNFKSDIEIKIPMLALSSNYFILFVK